MERRMRYYPVFLDVQNRACLVVGGGAVGERKVGTLLECGARVRVVCRKASDRVLALAQEGRIELFIRDYDSSDLEGAFLVISATDNETVNRKVSADCEAKGLLCNVADVPALCNFVLPSIVNQGDLTIAISTAGKSPAFAKRVRKELTSRFGPEYGPFLDLMGAVRKKLLAREHAPEEHKGLFEELIDRGLLDRVRERDVEGLDRILAEVLGPGTCVDGLCPEIDWQKL